VSFTVFVNDDPAFLKFKAPAPFGGMVMYVVYKNTSDFPDKIVVRRWEIANGKVDHTPWHCTADTIEAARSAIPQGMVQVRRLENDDPRIVEVWL
jgi:hypothetical protein